MAEPVTGGHHYYIQPKRCVRLDVGTEMSSCAVKLEDYQ
jgi:hypothetical protein